MYYKYAVSRKFGKLTGFFLKKKTLPPYNGASVFYFNSFLIP
ncbi:Uncharacterized protein dnm_003350 [Desulfonema magnum]|uniref:Uncharacterized protein n=1 Tax=Desulfonema magnum TaxID=45655 RepID=A0A975GK49_9BACT|nr:Uncharacterized protein dnm_003350 [Desulfonema magnum]